MAYTTREIIRTLKLFASEERPIKREDIIYARRLPNNPLSKKLAEIPLGLLFVLKERGYLTEDFGYRITPQGQSLLLKFEEARKKYGSKNVEIVPAMEGNKIIYRVRITINRFERFEKKKSIEKVEYRDGDALVNFLSTKDFIKRIKKKENFLQLKTTIKFYRTTKEIERLNKIAEELGIEIERRDEYPQGYQRNYVFHKCGQPIVTLISQKRGRGFKSIKPLEIEVNLKSSMDLSKNLLESLFHQLYIS